MVRQIKIKNNQIIMEDDYELIFEKEITKFGTGAKIDAPKEYLGRKVYVLIRKE